MLTHASILSIFRNTISHTHGITSRRSQNDYFSHPPPPGSMLVLQSRGNQERGGGGGGGEGGCVNNFVRYCSDDLARTRHELRQDKAAFVIFSTQLLPQFKKTYRNQTKDKEWSACTIVIRKELQDKPIKPFFRVSKQLDVSCLHGHFLMKVRGYAEKQYYWL